MKKIILFLPILLAACGSFQPREILTVEKLVYPELPPVPDVSALELLPCVPDRPRVWWEPKVVKSDDKCRAQVRENPEILENSSFQEDCMEHRIDTESNIVIGFDKENQQCYVLNREIIRMQLKQYKERINHVNEQRKVWKERNAEDRRAAENQPTKQ